MTHCIVVDGYWKYDDSEREENGGNSKVAVGFANSEKVLFECVDV